MVRNFPTGESPQNHPLLSRTFFFALIAATIAIISFLCGKKKKRKSTSSINKTTKANENTQSLVSKTNDQTNDQATHVKTEDKINDHPPPDNYKIEDTNNDYKPPESTVQIENIENIELPIPPRLASLRASSSYHIGGSSRRSQGAKLTSSMSMRLSGQLKGLKRGSSKREEKQKDQIVENDKLTREDSVWKKTIILGEKCKIPDEEEDDIIFDENGQRINTFHRKPSCLSVSSQSSNLSKCDPY